MKVKLMSALFLLTVIAVAGVQQSIALPAYLNAYNTTFNTNATCSVCHVNPAGGGSLNSYGMYFQNQPNYNINPAAALANIGPTTVTPAATTTVAATATTTMTATPAETLPLIATETPTEIPTTIIETPTEVPPTTMPTATQTTPGFEQAVFVIGLLAGYVLLKQHNK
ncbi:MAG TPA: hypothetical protein VIO58_06690 [Candidatus Methanoperedens sp.]